MSSPQNLSSTKSGSLASPPELHFRFPTPTPIDHLNSPIPGVRLHSVDRMSIAAATNPAPLSPPPSPAVRRLSTPPVPSSPSIADRPLFPAQAEAPISLYTPLFHVSEQFEPMIQDAIASADHSFRRDTKRKVTPKAGPTVEEYNLFVSSAWRLCQSNPRRWLEQEDGYMALYYAAKKREDANRIQKSNSNASRRNLQSSRMVNASSVLKPRTQVRRARTPRMSTPKSNAIDGFASSDGRFPTPTSQTSGSAPSRIRSVAPREDTDFESIPDMSPPIETLDGIKGLKADWKGTALDLSNDPHHHLLHPSEVGLASTLRLSCASYLTSKRRIFVDKVERAKQGKEFRKTDAQKACRIDVNKASKLWAAYEKAGWFDRRHIVQYLD